MGDLKPLSAEEIDNAAHDLVFALEKHGYQYLPKFAERLIAQARRALELEAENADLKAQATGLKELCDRYAACVESSHEIRHELNTKLSDLKAQVEHLIAAILEGEK